MRANKRIAFKPGKAMQDRLNLDRLDQHDLHRLGAAKQRAVRLMAGQLVPGKPQQLAAGRLRLVKAVDADAPVSKSQANGAVLHRGRSNEPWATPPRRRS